MFDLAGGNITDASSLVAGAGRVSLKFSGIYKRTDFCT